MTTRLFFTTETTSTETIEELSRVKLKRSLEIAEAERVLPSGASGTIVAVLKDRIACLVEFSEPFEALIEVESGDLEAIPGESRHDLLARRMARRAS